MGLDYLCRWFYHLYNKLDFAQIDEDDIPWYDTINNADRLGGKFYIDGRVLLSAAGALGAYLSLNGTRPALPQV